MTLETIALTGTELTRFFLAMVLLLFSSQLLGYAFHKAKLPKVVGEILGGLLLGPTVLGYFSRGVQDWVFNGFPSEGKLIALVSSFGLILLMFVSGFEIERSFTREDRNLAVKVLLGATLVPFIGGLALTGIVDFTPYIGPSGNLLSFAIILAIAVAVTSIPVISKIFLDLSLINTRFAKLVLTVATVEDIILYAALAIAAGIAGTGTVSLFAITATVLVTAGLFLLALLLVPRLMRRLASSRAEFLIRSSPTRFALFTCLSLVVLASVLNVNVVFGAFLAGVVIGTMPQETFANARKHVKSFSLALFTPVYFAVVGLRLDLVHQFDPALFLCFLLFSTALKTAGTLAVGKLAKQDWLSSLNLAVALNARGGPGIVLATVAFDLGLISETFFVALVLSAIVTSLIAGYWFMLVKSRGLELLKSTHMS